MTDERLAKIREQYRESLAGKADDLESCWRSAQSDFLALERVGELRNLVHKLGGSAGMYGYDMLASNAKALERQLVDGPIDTSDRRKSVAEGVAQLLTLLRNGGDLPVPESE